MSNDLVPLIDDQLPEVNFAGDRLLVDDMSGSAASRRGYAEDLRSFAQHNGFLTPAMALAELLGRGAGHANMLAAQYRADLLQAGELSASTISRRLSSLRKFASLCKQYGKIDFDLEVPGVKVQAYRDTRGPGIANMKLLLAAARAQDHRAKAARDEALIRLLFALALRRSEAAGLHLADWEEGPACCVWILGKGKRDKEPMTVPGDVALAIRKWLEFRGREPGPLFLHFRGPGNSGLSADGVYRVLRELSAKAKLDKHVRPHDIRHTSITHSLDKSNGNVRAVKHLSRHKRMDTLVLYDDNRLDMAGEISELISGDLGGDE